MSEIPRYTRQEYIEGMFKTTMDEAIDAYLSGSTEKPFELVYFRDYNGYSIQFRVVMVRVPHHFERDREPVITSWTQV